MKEISDSDTIKFLDSLAGKSDKYFTDTEDLYSSTGASMSVFKTASGHQPLALGTSNHWSNPIGHIDQATGAFVARDSFSNSLFEDDSNFAGFGIPASPNAKITKARDYYRKDPIVNRSVKLLAQLSNDSFRISSSNEEEQGFYNNWWKEIGGPDFLSYFFLEFFRSGNVPIFKTLIPYKPEKYMTSPPEQPEGGAIASTSKVSGRSVSLYEKAKKIDEEYTESLVAYLEIKNAKIVDKEALAKAGKALSARKYIWSKSMIPGSYTILNPLSIEVKGAPEMPWLQAHYLKIDQKLKSFINNPLEETKEILKSIPKELISQITQGESEIYLPPHMMTMVSRDKQPYEPWADPLCTHAFEALDMKYEMRSMDKATVRGVRNRILKVTIGNDLYPVFDPKQIQALAKEFNNPARNLTLFWNHTLDVEYVEPTLDSLRDEKYVNVDDDIRANFGVSKVLIGDGGQAMGNNVLNLKGIVESLAEAQETFLVWFHKEVKRVVQALDLTEIPEAAFGRINLKDENDYMRVLVQMVDRQIISYETMVETIGYHFPREVERLKKEKALRDKEDILVQSAAPTQMSKEGQAPKGGGPSGQEGRPKGVKEEGDREGRKGGTRTPDGIKTVSSKDVLDILYKMRDEYSAFCTASSQDFDEKSPLPYKSVINHFLSHYNINENPGEVLFICQCSAKLNDLEDFNEAISVEIAKYIKKHFGDK